MTMGTIVTIVLLMSVLIMGLMLTRNIMCSGIQLTDDINEKMSNQVKDLFSESQTGVKCMGEGTQEIKIADGGLRKIWCIINTDKTQEYTLEVTDIQTGSGGVSAEKIESWIEFGKTQTRTIGPSGEPMTVVSLNIPEEVDSTLVRMMIKSTSEDGKVREVPAIFTIEHVGGFTKSMC